jgi:acetyl esterase/lipase
MQNKIITLTLSTVITLLSCFSCSPSGNIAADAKEIKMLNVAYGSFPSSKMDVYLPQQRNKQTAFVILIHGGAWTLGDKQWNTEVQDSLIAHGIASINLNYRFADDDKIHYPQLLADIDSAVTYCIQHASSWNTRRTGFVVSGTSAGGHLSLLYAFTTSKKINAIIANCPPTDLSDATLLQYAIQTGLVPVIEKITGAKYQPGQPLPPQFFQASPVAHIKNIPTLLIHGTADRTVPYSQSLSLQKALISNNVRNKLLPIDGADHDLNLDNPKTKALIFEETIAWIIQFGK